MTQKLYLASSSFSRKNLLISAKIPFALISQDADESRLSINQPLESLVRQLAEMKMKHIIFPEGEDGETALFLTADTLTMDRSGELYGKPKDRFDAMRMLRGCRTGATVGTSFCLDRMIYKKGKWHSEEKVTDYANATCIVDVPDPFMEFYLDHVPFSKVSGGITIEGFGEQFVKEVTGCYSAILGLPMFKLRSELYRFGFYNFKI